MLSHDVEKGARAGQNKKKNESCEDGDSDLSNKENAALLY